MVVEQRRKDVHERLMGALLELGTEIGAELADAVDDAPTHARVLRRREHQLREAARRGRSHRVGKQRRQLLDDLADVAELR